MQLQFGSTYGTPLLQLPDTLFLLLQYYADDGPQDDPEDFDANRAALGLRTRPRKVQSYVTVAVQLLA